MFDEEVSYADFVRLWGLWGKVCGEVGLELGCVCFGGGFPAGFVGVAVKVVGHLSCFGDADFPFWRETGGLHSLDSKGREADSGGCTILREMSGSWDTDVLFVGEQ